MKLQDSCKIGLLTDRQQELWMIYLINFHTQKRFTYFRMEDFLFFKKNHWDMDKLKQVT